MNDEMFRTQIKQLEKKVAWFRRTRETRQLDNLEQAKLEELKEEALRISDEGYTSVGVSVYANTLLIEIMELLATA